MNWCGSNKDNDHNVNFILKLIKFNKSCSLNF